MDAQGNHVGYMAEQEKGMGNMMARQWFRTHRSFVTHVFDRHENEVLRVGGMPSQVIFQSLTPAVPPSILLDQLSNPSLRSSRCHSEHTLNLRRSTGCLFGLTRIKRPSISTWF